MGLRTVDVLKSMTTQQLAWVGAIAMAYNDAEEALQIAFIQCVGPPVGNMELATKVSAGALPTLVLNIMQVLDIDRKILQLAERTLVGDGFTQLKKYRDGVIHARIFDFASGIGSTPNKGKSDSVLLTEPALEGLYRRLAVVAEEIKQLWIIVADVRHQEQRALRSDQGRARHEATIRAATAQLAQLQKGRKSLPPLPKFPEAQPMPPLDLHKMASRHTSKK